MSDSGKTQLYRHFDKGGKLLYVGISLSTLVRLSQHKLCSEWFDRIARVEIEEFVTRESAIAAEIAAIKKEKPAFNVMHMAKAPAKALPCANESKKELLKRIVEYRPLYRIDEVGRLLGISASQVERIIDSGQIGYIIVPKYTSRNRYHVSGWQLIEFLEAAQKRGILYDDALQEQG